MCIWFYVRMYVCLCYSIFIYSAFHGCKFVSIKPVQLYQNADVQLVSSRHGHTAPPTEVFSVAGTICYQIPDKSSAMAKLRTFLFSVVSGQNPSRTLQKRLFKKVKIII